MNEYAMQADHSTDPREQELIWTARTHPDELILPDVYPTRFPGTWVAIFEDFIPADQRNALQVEGYHLYRIRMLHDRKAQVVIREESHPDRGDTICHEATEERYEQYDRRDSPIP